MPRRSRERTALEVSRLKTPGMQSVGGVAGLHLQVTETGARSWILRVSVGGRRRDMGLGGFPDVPLASAREAARRARALIADGIDPIAAKRAAASALAAANASAITFEGAAGKYIDAHEAGWRNAKHAQQWRNTLATYAFPKIGGLLVRDVQHTHVLAVLEPIWTTKTETATRLRGRIESVLDWATARGYREGLNPARWRGHLDHLLPKPARVSKSEHHEALPLAEMSGFMQRLREVQGMGARALEFAILCASRSGEVRGATWSEVDLGAAVWKIPGVRMKATKEHRVPLSTAAITLLRELPRFVDNDLVFPALRGGQLSDMTLTAVLRRMKVPAVPHGFRSTFRDWVSERTNYPGEMAEMALAHTIVDKVEAAYRRGDMFERRREMMEDWTGFCGVC